ncbi:MAG TPA: hypothetical protein VMF58_01225 [Rhizomicrobium sp.]|nr:hypothetical protein [Rhizomicrobium sp.]
MPAILVSNKSSLFASGPETPIPPKKVGAQPLPVVYEWIIGLTPSSVGLPVPFIKAYPKDAPREAGDGPCDIRVHRACIVKLTLDPDTIYECEFRYPGDGENGDAGDGITLGPNTKYPYDPNNPRYSDVEPSIDDATGLCNSISFSAQLLAIKDANSDPFNLYIRLYFYNANGDELPVVTIRHDPDIKNPGDYGVVGIHHKK